jgi:hypothetical protein
MLVTNERKTLHARIHQGLTTDDSFMIYLDGMDQEKTDIPRLSMVDTNEFGSRMKVRSVLLSHINNFHCSFRLLGGLVYLKKSIPFGFFFPGGCYQADTNSNLECLRRILESLSRSMGVNALPRKLHIQLDNTCKDNKNYKFLLYCAYLIFAGYVTFAFYPIYVNL